MQPGAVISPEAYLAFDAVAEERHEYWHGQLVAMAGETYNHSAVKDDAVAALREHTSCDVLSAGLRVRAPGYGREHYAYPDGLVVCGEMSFDEATQPPTLLNPTLLIEVASPSTRARDFADKLEAYFRLESLVEYWILKANRPYIAQYERHAEGIHMRMIPGMEQEIHSTALGVTVPLRAIYRRVRYETD
ncbi:MAG: Uma2 family endonuclease [Bacteroidota bacterium]